MLRAPFSAMDGSQTALPSNVAPKVSLRDDPGAEETAGLDLSQVDRAPIGPALWKYMRRGEPMPGIVERIETGVDERTAIIRVLRERRVANDEVACRPGASPASS